MDANAIKRKIASAFDSLGINELGLAFQGRFLFPYIRVVNYHDIAPEHIENFERQLQFYTSRFIDVDDQALRDFLAGKPWRHAKPGIIVSFDDGLASHSTIAAPLLEKYGLTGWFFVPAERLNRESPREGDASAENVSSLARRHVVGSHTITHCRLAADVPEETMRSEILGSRLMLEARLGRTIDSFCWVGGEEYTYSSSAAKLVRSGYRLAFMTNNAPVRPRTDPFQIQRTNVEAENPLSLVRFQLSGFLDLLYFPKRRRVNRLTQGQFPASSAPRS